MKVGIYNPYLDSLSGGERYMLSIASCLQKRHEVDVFWNDESTLKQAKRKLSINLSNVKIVPNIFHRKIPIFKSMVFTRKYNLIIALSDGSVPFINAKSGILHFQRPFQNVNGLTFTNQIKLKKYKAVICNSQFTKKYVDKEFNVSSTVVYPPVPVDQFTKGKKEKIIISVGRFHPFKKQDVMISTFKKFSKKNPDWKLVLIGGLMKEDREYFDSLKKLSKRLPVELRHDISFATLQEYYAKTSMYWHAAGFGENESEHPENFEHFGIAPVEAMASGCIPIVFNGGGLPEIISDGEDGFLWNKKDELVDISINISRNKQDFSMMRKNAVTTSKRFGEKRFCKEVTQIISSLSR